MPTFVVPGAFSRQETPNLLDEVYDCRPCLSLLVRRCEVMESEFIEIRQLLQHTRGRKGLTMLVASDLAASEFDDLKVCSVRL